jgi:uncharacterized protein YndB with AHSA1/START domain
MTVPQPLVLRVSRRVEASPERVYDAWLDPARARRFLFATPTGRMVVAEIDARVGGRYRLVDRRNDEDAVHTGEYLELERPRRIVFTFAVGDEGATGDRVAVDISPSDGASDVTLTHEMDPQWAEYADRTREGWAGILDGLAAAVR